MTLQEAIKSGKPFRRKGMTVWCDDTDKYSREAILADDWELKPDEPKWISVYYYLQYEGGVYSPYLRRFDIKPLGESEKVLLIDSRPVKALVETLSCIAVYGGNGEKFHHAIEQVEQLLKESP